MIVLVVIVRLYVRILHSASYIYIVITQEQCEKHDRGIVSQTVHFVLYNIILIIARSSV